MKISPQAEQNIQKLEEYRTVLETFKVRDKEGALYAQKSERGYSLGEQVRHVVDYYGCLLRGFAEAGKGPYKNQTVRVDYIDRERSQEVEESIDAAIEKINQTIEGIRNLCSRVADDLLVLHRNNAEIDSWFVADMGTQLQINWVHAVHHAEIIMNLVKQLFDNFEFPDHFEMDKATIQKKDTRP